MYTQNGTPEEWHLFGGSVLLRRAYRPLWCLSSHLQI